MRPSTRPYTSKVVASCDENWPRRFVPAVPNANPIVVVINAPEVRSEHGHDQR